MKVFDLMGVDCELKFAGADAEVTGKFSGLASVFNNKDQGGDVIVRGAFADSIAEWKARDRLPPLLLQHGGGMFGGGADDLLPIGRLTSLTEQAKGLALEGELFALGTQRGTYIYEGMKAGALDGLSIGYRAKEFVVGTKPTEPRRTLKKIDLVEISVVTFPMNEKARITTVKSLDDLTTMSDVEAFLRDAGGLSRKQARGLISRIKALSPLCDAEDDVAELVARAQRLRDTIRK